MLSSHVRPLHLVDDDYDIGMDDIDDYLYLADGDHELHMHDGTGPSLHEETMSKHIIIVIMINFQIILCQLKNSSFVCLKARNTRGRDK